MGEIEGELNRITEAVIGAAIRVHRELGPGLLESAYEACMAYELAEAGLKVERQKELSVVYRAVNLDCGYRIDLWVEDRVGVELKTVKRVEPVHEAQVISYMKLSGCRVGLLINFYVPILTQGIKRFAN